MTKKAFCCKKNLRVQEGELAQLNFDFTYLQDGEYVVIANDGVKTVAKTLSIHSPDPKRVAVF